MGTIDDKGSTLVLDGSDLTLHAVEKLAGKPSPDFARGYAFWMVVLTVCMCTSLSALEMVSVYISSSSNLLTYRRDVLFVELHLNCAAYDIF